MKGSIVGDIVGSIYEFHNNKSTSFPLFSNRCRYTDDSVISIATMDALMNRLSFATAYKRWYSKYPKAGYGPSFRRWAQSGSYSPYNSYGNGSAMRVAAVAWWAKSLEEALKLAKESAMATHNHPEGVKGAQATAAAIYLAKTGSTKAQIKQYVEKSFGYYLDESVDSIRVWYRYDVSCQGTCPQAIRCFLESNDFEHAIRLAVSIGGDTDTIACITGSIAEALYGIPAPIEQQAMRRLPADLKEVVDQFYQRIGR